MVLATTAFADILCCLYHASELTKMMNQSYLFYVEISTICLGGNYSDPKAIHTSLQFIQKNEKLISQEICEQPAPGSDTDLCSLPTSNSNIAYSVFLILLMTIIFGTNLFYCCSMYYSRHLLRKPSHRFILSLAISDLLIALAVIPIIIYMTLHNQRFCSSLPFCHLAYFLDHTIVLSSILILLAIAIDRYIAVSSPYRYPNMMTLKRASHIIKSVWVLSFMFGLTSNIDWDGMSFRGVEITQNKMCFTRNRKLTALIILCCLFLPLVAMGLIYQKIFRITLQHTMPPDIGMLEVNHNSETEGDSEETSQAGSPKCLNVQIFRSRRNRAACVSSQTAQAAKAILIVYGTFVLSWLPGHIITFINLMWPLTIVLKPWQFHILNEIMPLFNAAMNVVIYVLMNDECKRAMQKFLCCKAVHSRIEMRRMERERQRRTAEEVATTATARITTTATAAITTTAAITVTTTTATEAVMINTPV